MRHMHCLSQVACVIPNPGGKERRLSFGIDVQTVTDSSVWTSASTSSVRYFGHVEPQATSQSQQGAHAVVVAGCKWRPDIHKDHKDGSPTGTSCTHSCCMAKRNSRAAHIQQQLCQAFACGDSVCFPEVLVMADPRTETTSNDGNVAFFLSRPIHIWL